MIWSDWKSLTSAGEINEALLPADAFQLRYFLQWEYDIVSPATMTASLTGKWRWTISDSSDDLIFNQENQVKVTLAWLYMGFGISMPLWWWDVNYDTPTTIYPETYETLGVEEFYLNPGAIDDPTFADPTIYVQTWYEGPIYKLPIPAGSTIALPFHNVGAYWLVKLANIQIRTATSGDADSVYDRPGFCRFVRSDSGRLVQYVTADDGNTWTTRRVVSNLSAPRIFKEATNRLHCAGYLGKQFIDLSSDNDGLTWEGPQLTLWDAGYTDADADVLRDGTIVTIARRGGYLWFRTGADQFSDTVRIGQASRACKIAVAQAANTLIATDGQDIVFRSTDGGKTWAEVEAVL